MLTKKTEDGPTWYAVPIHRLDTLLIKVIYSGRGYRHSYALRRNIAYNLQYLQYLDRTLQDLKLSSVISTQTQKSFIITGCGIIESLLHFLLVANKVHSTTEWEEAFVIPGNSKRFDGETRRIDVRVMRKLPSFVAKKMSFDTIIQKARTNRVLGSNLTIYENLRYLRPLRNRVHLQIISSEADTDWNSFSRNDLCAMTLVIKETFRSSIFHPSLQELGYFNYLDRYVAI